MFILLYLSISRIPEINLFIAILIIIFGAAIYMITMFIIGGLKREDIQLIRKAFKKN